MRRLSPTDATSAKGKRCTNRILMLPIERPLTLLNQGESRQLGHRDAATGLVLYKSPDLPVDLIG